MANTLAGNPPSVSAEHQLVPSPAEEGPSWQSESRYPLSRELLVKLVSKAACEGEHEADTLNLNAAFCMVFAGFLRLSDLTDPGLGKPGPILNMKTVEMEPGGESMTLLLPPREMAKYLCWLYWPPVSSKRKLHWVRIPMVATGDAVCPVHHMSKILVTSTEAECTPVFTLKEEEVFDQASVLKKLAARLQRLGFSQAVVSKGFSLRKGAIEYARRMGASEEDVQALANSQAPGSWSPDLEPERSENLLGIQMRIKYAREAACLAPAA